MRSKASCQLDGQKCFCDLSIRPDVSTRPPITKSNVGTPSAKLVQHYSNIESMCRVCWKVGWNRISVRCKDIGELIQQTRYIDPMLDQCWADVGDGGPPLVQHWVYVSCLLGSKCSQSDFVVASGHVDIIKII